jgi:DNA modification methylase
VLYNGEALEVMDKLIAEGVVVDAIITDPPYGTTACKWDSVIPFDAMWERLNKLIKPNGAIVLFGSEPFSSALRMSNIKNYKYDWIWNKVQKSNFLNAKKQPLRSNETISVFYKKQCTYNYQKSTGHKKKEVINIKRKSVDLYNKQTGIQNYSSTERYPHTILTFSKDTQKESFHPTQKPVALMEYLIKTYTNENEFVLDFTMGSGTTGVACKNLNRKFIGIEMDKGYFGIAKKRIEGVINVI